MFRRFGWACLLFLCGSVAARAQSSGAVLINTDIRVFTTMVALNAAGYDVELGPQYHPVREAVRNLGIRLDLGLVKRLQDFYRAHKRTESDDAQLSKYISLAVFVTDPPDFKLTAREEVLPPDARDVKDFVDLMREVYLQTKLTTVWQEFRPQYDAEIAKLAPSIREQLVKTDAYLRVPLGGASLRSLSIIIELAAPINSVNVRSDQDNYFLILGHSTTSHTDEIRHAYLHFQLDNLVALNGTKVANGPQLLDLVKNVEGIQRPYGSDFHAMMVESLIRAIEIRMDRMRADPAKDSVNAYYRAGLLLTPYFYEALAEFETQEAGIRSCFPDMARGIRLDTERERFASTFMSIPVSRKVIAPAEVPRPEPAPTADPALDLLKEGEAALNHNEAAHAKAAFERVLNEYDRNNGAALYGLALIASRNGETNSAREYFERTTRSESVGRSMKVWAYMYLGRIFDLECQRDRAVENYQQAIRVGDNTRNAQTAAKDGLKKPYGDGCW